MSNDDNLKSATDLQDDSAPQGAEINLAGACQAEPVDDSDCEPEVLEAIREEAREEARKVVLREYSGPMPLPEQFGAYDEILPGTAKVIRDEFQLNSGHVRSMEGAALAAQVDEVKENRKTAERVVYVSLGASIALALTGHDWVAGVVAGSTLVTLVLSFLGRKVVTNEELASTESKSDSRSE